MYDSSRTRLLLLDSPFLCCPKLLLLLIVFAIRYFCGDWSSSVEVACIVGAWVDNNIAKPTVHFLSRLVPTARRLRRSLIVDMVMMRYEM